MKVLDLACSHGHVFEGWFASEEEFRAQCERGLIECPVCGDRAIEKRLSAPYVQTRRADEPQQQRRAGGADGQALEAEWQARLLQVLRALVQDSEDVGERFAAEARAMHYGEIEARNIRGVTTPDEAAALIEEGVTIVPLPDSPLLKGPLQ
ncbi:MAG: DUF1178 family protein [Tepidimonas sp.]|uniref:DUF1178 family protein n=1 Tax=Tepidimonas sp. TaxID=2002775 RepID=UPI004055097E